MKKDIEEFYDEDEDEEFYTKKDLEQDRFYKMDKNLFNNSKYKGLSLGAKVVFSVLKDRQSLSESNQDDWLDEKNRIFFYFDCFKLSKLLEISTSTLNRHKKELEDYNLLFQFRQGQGKPNRMYCKKPKTIDNNLISQNDKSRIVKTTKLELSKRLTNDTEFNDTEYSETENYIKGSFKKQNELDVRYKSKDEFLKSLNYSLESNEFRISEMIYKEFADKIKCEHYRLNEEQIEKVREGIKFILKNITKWLQLEELLEKYFILERAYYSIQDFTDLNTLSYLLSIAGIEEIQERFDIEGKFQGIV